MRRLRGGEVKEGKEETRGRREEGGGRREEGGEMRADTVKSEFP